MEELERYWIGNMRLYGMVRNVKGEKVKGEMKRQQWKIWSELEVKEKLENGWELGGGNWYRKEKE
jgi:hypothetical protein